jgi:lipopolysaccharide transport system permease protein
MRDTWLGQLRADLGEMLHEQYDYRELLYRFTARDLLLRYKQTAMGFGWAVFMPLVNTAIFSVVFTRVAHVDTGGIPYPVYAFCGLLAWNFFASTLRTSVASLTTNVTLVTKVYFPREIFPFSALIVSLVDSAVAAIVLVGLMAYYRIGVTPVALLLPVLIVVQVCFTGGIALMLAMANLFYRDVKYLFEVVIVVWMFATSVLYPVALVGGRAGALLRLNPMTPLVDAYRSVLLRGELPALGPYAAAAGVSVLVLVAAWAVFHRAEFTFAENV